jgi:ribosomal protein S18 acetylase RimI-like enzyme
LDTIAVDEAYRGHGIGSKLLESLPTIAKKSGKKVIGLSVDDANPKAKALYERVGFKGVKKTKISGHDYLHMYWSIDA